jgi:hypothetical protein
VAVGGETTIVEVGVGEATMTVTLSWPVQPWRPSVALTKSRLKNKLRDRIITPPESDLAATPEIRALFPNTQKFVCARSAAADPEGHQLTCQYLE